MTLTPIAIRNAERREKPCNRFDEGGLYLLIQPNGGRYWRFKGNPGRRKLSDDHHLELLTNPPPDFRYDGTRVAGANAGATEAQQGRNSHGTSGGRKLRLAYRPPVPFPPNRSDERISKRRNTNRARVETPPGALQAFATSARRCASPWSRMLPTLVAKAVALAVAGDTTALRICIDRPTRRATSR